MDNDRERLLRQARQHVDSLRLAGVEWMPVVPRPIDLTAAERERCCGSGYRTGRACKALSWEHGGDPRGRAL